MANGQRAYIGSFTSAGGYGITTAAVDPDSGRLTETGRTAAVADPSFLALSPDATVLYAVSEHPENGGAAALSLRDPDDPTPLAATVPVGGGAPTHLCLAAGHLLTANYASGSVSVLRVRPDGTLGAPRHVLRHDGGGPNQERQEGPHAHAVLPDPSGRWVLSVDLGTDSVRVCALDPGSGRLRVRHETVLRPGSGPRHLVFHPRGHRAYAVNELESSVTVLAWDARTGVLTPLGSTATVPKEAAERPNHPSEAVISPDARFVWLANRGHDSIAVLSLDADGDALELLGTHPCGGHWPRHLTLDPAGRRLYAANERSGDVTWFDLEQATGRPRRVGSLPVPAASCVVFG